MCLFKSFQPFNGHSSEEDEIILIENEFDEFEDSDNGSISVPINDDSDDDSLDYRQHIYLNSSEDDSSDVSSQNNEDVINGDDDYEDMDDEGEEDAVVAAFMSASSESNRNHPPNLSVSNQIGALSFHPTTNVIALGLSNGDIEMYKFSNQYNEHIRTNDNVHLKKLLVVEFNHTGDYIYSACRDNNVSISDVETGKMKVYFEKAHRPRSFVSSLAIVDENIFATGDEEGVVNVWDVRANGCRFSLKKNEDSIHSMINIDNSNNQPTLACASGDGTLTIIDLSTKKMLIQSEPYRSVLTSCVTMKRKTKLVCGSGEGSFITFNTGNYSAFNDEFPCVDKGAAINKLVPVTENIVLSALDNGKIRATNLFPNCHLGIVGYHQDMSIDLLDISDTGHIIASASHFTKIVKFWNIGYFEDFDTKNHLKKNNPKEFNLPSSNGVNATDFFSSL